MGPLKEQVMFAHVFLGGSNGKLRSLTRKLLLLKEDL